MAQSQYATATDIVALSIPQAIAARFGATAITAQLQAASSIADTYLPSQFTLPLITWDQGLRLRVCNIAAYYLYFQYGIADTDHLISDRYKEAIQWLEQIRDKKIFPVYADSSGDSPPTAEAGVYVVSDQPVGFTNRGLTNTGGCWLGGNGWWW